MTDDWSMPTGEYELQPRPGAADATRPNLPPPDEEIDPAFGVTTGELRIVDAFFYELARDAAEDPRPPTGMEQPAIDDLRTRFERLKAMSTEELDAERTRVLLLDRP